MEETYKTIYDYGNDEVTIKKSKFIGYAKPINSEDEGIKFIEEIKSKHKDATHNVFAYVCGQNNIIQRYCDDGEPSGTAGVPMLEVLKKENLRNVAVVVTRYFGGIKLGTGGLVRAYTTGCKIALESGKVIEKVLYTKVDVRIDYTLLGKVENDLLRIGYIIDSITYDDAVNLIVLCENSKLEGFKNTMIEITSSRVQINEKEEEYYSKKDGNIIR